MPSKNGTRAPSVSDKYKVFLPFIVPQFNYCPEIWHFCDKSATAKLEKVNERALRFVCNEKQTRYSELLNRVGLQSLVNQHVAKIVYTVFHVISIGHITWNKEH